MKDYIDMTEQERAQWIRDLVQDTRLRYDEATFTAILTNDNNVIAALTHGIITMQQPIMHMLFGQATLGSLCRTIANIIYLRGYEHGKLAAQTLPWADGVPDPDAAVQEQHED